MNRPKAWLCLLLFGGVGIHVDPGFEVAKDPDCTRKCFTDTLSKLIDRIGPAPAALGPFASAAHSFVYWMQRAWRRWTPCRRHAM